MDFLDEQKLKALPYLDYLKFMRDKLKDIVYAKGSSKAYHDGMDLIRNVINRYIKENNFTHDNYYEHNEIGSMLRHNQVELGYYAKYNNTDKGKSSTISTFKSDMDTDLTRLIHDEENKLK